MIRGIGEHFNAAKNKDNLKTRVDANRIMKYRSRMESVQSIDFDSINTPSVKGKKRKHSKLTQAEKLNLFKSMNMIKAEPQGLLDEMDHIEKGKRKLEQDKKNLKRKLAA